jgi:hypothetical protein
VENVFIQNPASGAWTIEVTAADVNMDGHEETPAWDVDYALVISGGNSGNDCNLNDVPDDCDLNCAAPGCSIAGCGLSDDCNSNSIPDECELPDCNGNDIPDGCELVGNDCNADLVPDDCQLAGNDCNANLTPDDCDEAALEASITAPADQHPCAGGEASFNASTPGATGYQWYRGALQLSNGGNIAGATSAALTVDPANPADEETYTCVVNLGCISATSAPAELDLTSSNVQVTLISASPVQACASAGATVAAFEVSVDDATGVSYQWDHDGEDLVDGGNVSGATTARVEIDPATGPDVGTYTCTVTNACMPGAATAAGELHIAASFAEQPPATLCAEYGDNAVFSAEAADPQPDFFLWYEGATPLSDGGRFSGTSTNTLTLSNVQAADNGRTFRLRLVEGDPFCSNYSQNSQLQALPVGDCPDCLAVGDMDNDGDYDLSDLQRFAVCFGADVTIVDECACANVAASDTVVNLADWAALSALLSGPQ